jgi:hypothetical protein
VCMCVSVCVCVCLHRDITVDVTGHLRISDKYSASDSY